jgi:ParB-like chromosome segregation protein Spo0J
MDIQDIDPKKLKPYSLNAKKHPPEQIEKIIRSINLSGFDQPIVVNKEGKDLVLIKGHGRLLASLQMGLKEVPTVVLELPKLVADQARLMDNKSAESDYDVEVLVKELSKFNTEQIIDTGFSADDLQGMIMQLENSIDFGSIDDSEDDRNDEENNGSTKEIDVDSFEFEHTCPKCGFQYND